MVTPSHQENRQAFILRLSQELIDEIIDFISGWGDLLACSVVCRAFRRRCEKHIFSTIKFSPFRLGHDRGGRTRQVQELEDILSRKPYISRYIQTLYVLLDGFDQEWMLGYPGFLNIMNLVRQACSLKTLELGGLPGCIEKILSPRRFEEFVCMPFLTPFLSSIFLSHVRDVPLALVTKCANLKTLKLSRTTFDHFLTISQGKTHLIPKIETLSFDDSTQAIDTLLQREVPNSRPLLDFSTLRVIETNTDCLDNIRTLQNVFEASSGSIEEVYLELGNSYEFVDISEWPDFSALSRLYVLHIDTLFTHSEDTADCLTSVCNVLNTVPSTNVLEELRIRMFIDGDITPEEAGMANWAFLDHEIQRLSSGKELDFYLHTIYSTSTEDDEDEESEEESEDEGSSSSNLGAEESDALWELTLRNTVNEELPIIFSDPNIFFNHTIGVY